MRRHSLTTSTIALAAILGSASLLSLPAASAEAPVAAEKNPPGDIPDSQVFIKYDSPLGFTLQVPEGWARKDRTEGASFADKYGKVDVAVSAAVAAPTVASVKTGDAAALEQAGHAVKIDAIKAVKLPSGPSVLITYHSNSEPNAVSKKKIRLEHDRYLIAHDGKLAILDLSAPAGADNVDQWKLMSDSFGWK